MIPKIRAGQPANQPKTCSNFSHEIFIAINLKEPEKLRQIF